MATSNYFAELYEDELGSAEIRPRPGPIAKPKPTRLTSLIVGQAEANFPPLSSEKVAKDDRWPPNYRTEACHYGERCRNRFECSYYHSEAERRMVVYEGGEWVNAKYSKTLAEKKENFRQQRQAKTQALKDQGKWKTVRCIREEGHAEQSCPFYHSEEDRNVEAHHLMAKKKYDSFLEGELKRGVVLRWG